MLTDHKQSIKMALYQEAVNAAHLRGTESQRMRDFNENLLNYQRKARYSNKRFDLYWAINHA